MAEQHKQADRAGSPGEVLPRSKDLDAHKQKVMDELAGGASPTGQDDTGGDAVEKAKATAEREPSVPKQPGHLDTRRPRITDVDEQD